MKRIVFIYNPFSGRKKNVGLPRLVSQVFETNQYECHLWATEKAEDVDVLTQKAIAMQVDCIVAAGGDGTINGISKNLVGTSIPLGIVPLGSGNGFARHMGISMQPQKAMEAIINAQPVACDSGLVNNRHFVNVAGVGFDAHISSLFAAKTKRGLQGYVKAIVSNIRYKGENFEVFEGGKKVWDGKAFLISIANGSQWGNNFKIAPGASLDDGLLNVIVLKDFRALRLPSILFQFLQGNIVSGKYFEVLTGENFLIKRSNIGAVHVDGEPFDSQQELNITIKKKQLLVLKPR